MKCPECGWFLKNVTATVICMGEQIKEVKGMCKKHGEVEPLDWSFEDFFPDGVPNSWWEANHVI